MGKKKKAELDAQYETFSAGMKASAATPPRRSRRCGTSCCPFSDYAFNKAHSAAYGLVSYWTAYLKANYPAEYMAALLTSVKDDKDKMAVYLAECRRMGIKVLPPCVNSSDANFTPTGTDIRFGLTAVRNVGANVVASIVATRKEKGAFTDFADFLRKVDAVVCNKRTIEALIKGGAFDSLGPHPARADQRLRAGRRRRARHQAGRGDRPVRPVRLARRRETGDDPADDVFAVRVPDGEWDKKVLLQFEREMLGLYVSDHPLFGLEHVLGRAPPTTSIAAVQAEARERAAVDHPRRHPVRR